MATRYVRMPSRIYILLGLIISAQVNVSHFPPILNIQVKFVKPRV